MHLLLTISGCEAQNPTRHPAAWPKPKLARHGALPAGGDGHLQVTWNFFGFGSKEIRKSNERYKNHLCCARKVLSLFQVDSESIRMLVMPSMFTLTAQHFDMCGRENLSVSRATVYQVI